MTLVESGKRSYEIPGLPWLFFLLRILLHVSDCIFNSLFGVQIHFPCFDIPWCWGFTFVINESSERVKLFFIQLFSCFAFQQSDYVFDVERMSGDDKMHMRRQN